MIRLLVFVNGPAGEPFCGAPADVDRLLDTVAVGCVECVRSRAIEVQPAGAAPRWAGVLELGFTELDAARAVRPADLAALLADDYAVDGWFIGHPRVAMRQPGWRAAGEPVGMKGMFPFSRRKDLDLPAFQRHWWCVHGPIAARTEQATSYVLTFLPEALFDDPDRTCDAVTELYWPTVEAAEAAMASRQMVEDQSNDVDNFVDRDSVMLVYLREEVVRAWHG